MFDSFGGIASALGTHPAQNLQGYASSFGWSQYQQPICNICGQVGVHAHEINKKSEGGRTMFKSLKEYVEKHSDLIWTVISIVLLDHFLFEGKFKAKIEQIMENLISKASDKVHAIETKRVEVRPNA